MDKKGTVGLGTGKKVMLALMTIGVLAFAIIVVLVQLEASNPAVAGSTAANQSTNIINNITGGVESFFSNAGTWFALLAIVVIILIVVIVMKSVNGIGGSKGGL